MCISRVVCRSLPLLILLLAASAAIAAAQGRVLRYRHSPGDTALYDCKLSSRAQGKSDSGQKIQVEMSLTMNCGAEFLGDTASGDYGLRGVINSGTLKVKSGGQPQEIELPEFAERYLVSPRGEIKSASVLSGQPPILMYGGLFLIMGPDDPVLLGGTAIFPDKPLKAGDRWKGTARIPVVGTGEVNEVKYESVLLGEETFRGTVSQKIKTATSTTIADTVDAPDGSGSLRAKGTITTQDTWLFDPQRGVILYSERSARIAMTVKVEQGGQVVEGYTTSGVLNEKSTLTQFNGTLLTQ
jgi:hypothetical protein